MKNSQVLFALTIAAICSQALSQQPIPSGRYDGALGQIQGAARTTRIIMEICNEEFPEQRAKNEKLYEDWRSKRLPLLQELDRRMAALTLALAQGDPKVEADNEAAYQTLFASFKGSQRLLMAHGGHGQFEDRCNNYGALTVSKEWDLESVFAEQLVTVRKRPE